MSRGTDGGTDASPALLVRAPLAGRVLSLAEVPDPVFAEAMVGPGVAVDPDPGRAAAVTPVAGRLVKLHPHAFVLQDPGGRGLLVHLGIDTVQLKGQGFRLLVAEGDELEAGTPVVEWDPAEVVAGGRSAVCPVIALDAPAEAVRRLADDRVEPGAELFSWS